jgi:hypothetical protein
MSPETLTWRAVQRCDHDGVCDFCLGSVVRSGYVEGVLRETNRQMSANPYIKDVMIDCQAEQGGGLFNRIAQMTL